MVLFHDNPDKYDSTCTVERIQKEVNICIELDMQVQKMEEAICTNPVFVKKASGAMDEDDGGRSSAASALQGAATKVPSFSI